MYTPFKMKGHTLPGINQKIDKKKSALKNKDLDSIDNNRHAPARTKDTVDPADVKKREKKNTSKAVPTDKEARASRAKDLYKKSPAKKKSCSAVRMKNEELKKMPKKEAKPIDTYSKVSGLQLTSGGKEVRQSMSVPGGKTLVNKRTNREIDRDYRVANQPKAKVSEDMPKGKKKRRTKRFERKAMKS